MIASIRKILNALSGGGPKSASRDCLTLEEYVDGTAVSVSRLSVGLHPDAAYDDPKRYSGNASFIHPVAVERQLAEGAFLYAAVSGGDQTEALIRSCDVLREIHNLDCANVIARAGEAEKIIKQWEEFFTP